ncbi:DUF418 domain-containing protein [Anaerobacillus alkaliphilus]|uniref:DUF418 domain-containing protein n=1 Tax=Anaerobacillus alkaliphilus TaxID=1548597 RepID=A0A4Q0VUM1_9BACI|nr:DUF418 domain-containing protein [Anaerobacillus alkaliphilus]RXJ02440.1 DUF418 domain-containing protein [Anaerobacillus alkaliphilus]
MDAPRLRPTQQGDRIITLDIIRGFALLGILLVNMNFFVAPELFLLLSGDTLFDGAVSKAADGFVTIFATGKFFTTFSFLFGLGFFIFMERVKDKGLSVGKLYFRRILFLLFLGLFHIFILWSGDILLNYALAAFFLLLFRKSSKETIKKWAIGLFSVVIFITAIFSFLSSLMDNVLAGEMELTTDYSLMVEEALVVFQNGSFSEILSFRLAEEIPFMLSNYIITVPMVLAIFLIGLYVGKKGVLYNISGHLDWIKKVWKNSMIFGVLMTVVYVLLKAELFIVPFYFHEAAVEVLSLVSGLVMSFFYISSITLLCQKELWLARLKFLAPVGQMALTNYLLQTVICIFLFNGYGFGFYGKVTPELGILITVAIFTVQIFLSKAWMARFKYGPLERLWRLFTYRGV